MEHHLIVVGAGHAGCEAALAAARLGVRVTVVTLDEKSIARMPCNPAVGGIGKGHLVAELDALGGVQGWATDRAGLQFKTLNASRGPAVWGPRAQCDIARYTMVMTRLLRGVGGIKVLVGEVSGLLVDDRRVNGVRMADGRQLNADAVVLTTGTFLGGLLHTGDKQRPGGRFGEKPSVGLGAELEGLGLELRRYKTGTPPRIHRDSLCFDRMREQLGDPVPRPFSWRTKNVRNRHACWITRTPRSVAEIIRENVHRAPLFSGAINGVGPRYCPSIEDKVVRFPHHEEHTVFVEPEGETTPSMYLNGLSTSLPKDVQEEVVRRTPGLENAVFLRYGYAVEYDVIAPSQTTHTLEVRGAPGLYVAGQLLGTSGYEEAAALGFIAGVNGVCGVRGEKPLRIGREQAYIGVLVDDITTREHREPYRMMTSRAEHRLVLGVDSARERLMTIGVDLGLVPHRAFHVEQCRWERRETARRNLLEERLLPNQETRHIIREIAGVDLGAVSSWARVLCRNDIDVESVSPRVPALQGLTAEDQAVVVARLRYEGYIQRHERERERIVRLRHIVVPAELALVDIPGLSREVIEVLQRYRPRTIAEAEGLPGVTPAAVAILVGWLTGRRRRGDERRA